MVLLVGSLTIVWFYYNKPHRSVNDETAIAMDAASLFEKFQSNETEANSLFLNKVLEVKGRVGTVALNTEKKSVIFLETNDPIFGINCTLNNNKEGILVGDSIVIKGICTGYLSDVILVRCEAQTK